MMMLATTLQDTKNSLINIEAPEEWIIVHNLSDIEDNEKEKIALEYETSDLVICHSTQIRFHDDNTTTFSYQNFRKIISLQGLQALSEYSIEFMPLHQRIIIHNVSLHRNGKKIDKTGSSHYRIDNTAREHMGEVNSGYGRLTIIVKDLKIDDTLEIHYSIHGSNPSLRHHYSTILRTGSYYPIIKSFFRIIAPRDKKLYFKNHRTTLKPLISVNEEHPSQTDYIYDFQPDYITSYEEYIPSGFDQIPFIEITDMRSWNDLYALIQDSYQTPIALPPALRDILEELDSAHNLLTDKITGCVDYVQKQIRYQTCSEPLYSVRPFSINEIMDNGFGDCKNKSLLLVTMLNYFQVEAYAALVNADSPFQPIENLPRIFAFDHAIVTFFLNGKQFWIDTTNTYQHGNIENRYILNTGYAYILRENENALTLIPEDNLSKITSYEEFDFSQVPEKLITLRIKEILRGRHATRLREILERETRAQLSKIFIDFHKKFYSQIEWADELEVIDDKTADVITTIEKYILPLSAIDSDQENIYLRSVPIRNYLDYPKEYKTRENDYAVDHPIIIEHTIKLTFSRPIFTTPKTAKRSIHDPVFDLDCVKTESKNEYILTYKFASKSRYVDQKNLDAYVENVNTAFYELTLIPIPQTLFNKKWLDKNHPLQPWRKIWKRVSDFTGEWILYAAIGSITLKIIRFLWRTLTE